MEGFIARENIHSRLGVLKKTTRSAIRQNALLTNIM
jgi:hypothetical protein